MTDQEFFVSEMDKALEAHRAKALALERYTPELRRKVADSFTPLATCIYGMMGSAQMEAMAEALLTMETGLWETFYRGYVDWQRDLPECRIAPEKFEENARGAMLLALKYRIKDQSKAI